MPTPLAMSLWLLVVSQAPPIELVGPTSQLAFDGAVFSERLGSALHEQTARPVRVSGSPSSGPVEAGSRVVVSILAGVQLCRLVAERFEASAETATPLELTTARCAELRAEGLDYAAFSRQLFPEPRWRDGTKDTLLSDEARPSSSATVPIVLASVGGALAVAGLVAMILGLNAVDDPPHPFDYERQRDTQRTLLIGGGGGLAAGVGLIGAALLGALAE